LTPVDQPKCTINGHTATAPFATVTYTTMPAIPASMLTAGLNTLVFQVKSPSSAPGHLFGLTPADLRIQTGPILGCAGNDFFTLACRTNMPVPVTLTVSHAPAGFSPDIIDLRTQTSPAGLFHSFRFGNLNPNARWVYAISVEQPPYRLRTAPQPLRLIPPGQRLSFATFGDSKKNLKDWAAVASAVVKASPDFVVHLGDMVDSGTVDARWDGYLFAPDSARQMFAAFPTFAVLGNHEGGSPLFHEFFIEPYIDATKAIWSQSVNGVLLVGIDGAVDWSLKGKHYADLEKILSEARAKFVFLFSHYPGVTSSRHGAVDDEGEPSEKITRACFDRIIPLAAKYRVSALVTGHEHCYERSELPGLTQIVTGTAGADRRKQATNAKQQNPYSKVFASELNFGLFEIDGDTCTMTAYTPAGKELDKIQIKARTDLPTTGKAQDTP
jgi:predicted phosphodiesterase